MIQPGAGILLIADPFLKDPNFLRTVVFLCEHTEEASFGFVINRPYTHTLDELITDLKGHSLPVYYGGPVQMDTIHFLHQYPDIIPGGTEVMKGVFWGGEIDKAFELIKSGMVNPSKIRFYLGYSGWGSNQLQGEMEQKSWLTVKATRKLVFHEDANQIWKDALRQLGGDYEMMINFPVDPQLN